MKSSNALGMVGEIERCTTVDGPGIRAIVFLKGCPLRCRWCHNPEYLSPEIQVGWERGRCIGCGRCVSACPEGAVLPGEEGLVTDPDRCTRCMACVGVCPAKARRQFGRQMTAGQVFREIIRDAPFYRTSQGGVTVSGGEPLMQPDFVESLFLRCREAGVHTALDTCGHAEAAALEQVLPYTDLVLYDLKLADPERHRELTGAETGSILQNLDRIDAFGIPIWIRTPVVPGMTDSPENILAIADKIEGLNRVARWELLSFHRFGEAKYRQLGWKYSLAVAEPPTPEQMIALRELASRRCSKEIFVR